MIEEHQLNLSQSLSQIELKSTELNNLEAELHDYEDQLDERNKTFNKNMERELAGLTEKEAKLSLDQSILIERESEINKLQQELLNQSNSLNILAQKLAKKEEDLSNQSQSNIQSEFLQLNLQSLQLSGTFHSISHWSRHLAIISANNSVNSIDLNHKEAQIIEGNSKLDEQLEYFELKLLEFNHQSEELSRLSAHNSATQSYLIDYERDLDSRAQNLSIMKSELESVCANLNNFQQELNNREENLKRNDDVINQKMIDLEALLAEKDQQVNESQVKIANLIEQVSSLELENQNLTAELDSPSTIENSKVEAEFEKSKQSELDELLEQSRAQSNLIAQERERLADLELQLSSRQILLLETEQKTIESLSILKRKEENLIKKETEVDQKSRDLDQKESKLIEREASVENLLPQIREKFNELKSREEQLNEYTIKIKSKLKFLRENSEILKIKEKEVSGFYEQIGKIKSSINNFIREINSLDLSIKFDDVDTKLGVVEFINVFLSFLDNLSSFCRLLTSEKAEIDTRLEECQFKESQLILAESKTRELISSVSDLSTQFNQIERGKIDGFDSFGRSRQSIISRDVDIDFDPDSSIDENDSFIDEDFVERQVERETFLNEVEELRNFTRSWNKNLNKNFTP
ncbi:hypothetical protein RCL1_004449 [Eukaryota sp. TZLM3-RCL]